MRRLLAFALLVLAVLTPASAGVKALNAIKGVPVWFAEDHTLPMLAVTASFPAGSAYDPPGKAGMAAFAAALLDEGAGSLSSDAFQSALAAHGIRLEAEAGRDVTTVTLVTLSANAKEAFRLLAMALAHPRFDGDAVARVRDRLLQDIALAGADPSEVAENGFYSLYFGPYTYGRPVRGDLHGLRTITSEELRTFTSSHWVRGGLRIAAAGDVSPADLGALLRAAFGGLPATQPQPPPAPVRAGAPGLHILPMDVVQPAIVFGLPGLMRSDRDFAAAEIANYILGGSEASRLLADLRDDRGLVYDVSTELAAYRRAGILIGRIATRQSAVRRSVDAVRDAMRRFASDGPTGQELADAKLYLTGSFALALASNADMAARLNLLQQEGLPLDYIDRRSDSLNAVTLDDVNRVARRLFDPAKMTIVVAGALPKERAEAARTSPP